MSPLALIGAATPGWHAWFAIAVTVGIFVGLQRRAAVPVDLLFLAGLVVVTLAGVVTPTEALAGFSSGAVILIGALFAASAALRTTGALDWIGALLLGGADNERSALRRLALVTPLVSSVVLNTPLVAMLAPVVMEWCQRRNVSPSRMLIPLSYLTILGGVCTVIGTSTTLVCNAQLSREVASGRYDQEVVARIGEIGFGEITWVGAPLAVLGVCYVLLIAPKLLPNRGEPVAGLRARRREYLVEMIVLDGCPLVGKTVEEAGLRQLPGLFLIEIDRDQDILTPVAPTDRIAARDRMVFTGVVETIADLERIQGLVPAADHTYEVAPAQRSKRRLAEAVLSRTSPILGQLVREASFRQRYNAAIVAIHRNGERLTNKIGDIRLEPGDTLLLQAGPGFVETHRNNRDFYLVSGLDGSSARRHDRALAALGLFVLLIAWLIAATLFGGDGAAWGHVLSGKPQPVIAILIVLAMIASRCLTTSQARQAIDLQVLITIAAAVGVGNALSASGAADWIAGSLVSGVAQLDAPEWLVQRLLLASVYVTSMLLTEVITNIAVATIMMPLAIGVAVAAGIDPRPFIIAVAIASSLSFATPIGYQTNLMVMGPGGYQPRDYLRVGLPLALVIAAAATLLIPAVFPLVR
ncbi:Sodium-dependent dicarboxylate transporter SdcS [Pirellulimonas nuda]|uniref:Sodium-dependent dicarboxylate transporter SdcS n=1 Tax=Pirellulimonas nuda TaxID=2528009 RepID=A0A518DJ66_9BACT|nr:Sodium-dependent dicarboxylate transporter SdcS [Pirellulimonas nuda]